MSASDEVIRALRLLGTKIFRLLLQLAVAFALPGLGLEKVELILNRLVADHRSVNRRWIAKISPLGYVFVFAVNTLIYGANLLGALRTCAYLRR